VDKYDQLTFATKADFQKQQKSLRALRLCGLVFIRRFFFLILTRDLRLILIHQYSVSRAFKVIKLVRAYRPHEYPHDDNYQDQGEGDE
jgi:hypothetical protein